MKASTPGPLAVRGTPDELAALLGQRVVDIRRRGKFLLVELERDRIVVNPMLTGRFQLAAGVIEQQMPNGYQVIHPVELAATPTLTL